MTTKEIIALAKEKLGRDITEQEAQNYLSGKTSLPDEALALVSGGKCEKRVCPYCGSTDIGTGLFFNFHCGSCGRAI